jgi:major membrane immunogen (membrane-anchored lipoprotein)
MAFTFTPVQYPTRHNLGANQKLTVTDITMADGDYLTGGITVTPANLGLSSIDAAIVQIKTADADIVVTNGAYIAATGKIKLNDTDSEVANAAAVGGLALTIVAWGAP